MNGPWYSSTLGKVLLLFFVAAILAFFMSIGSFAKADVVEFSEEELSRESVLPVFDQPEAVKKRIVPTDSRIELDAMLGVSLNDPFISEYPVGLDVEYHLNEINAVGINATYFLTSATSYVSQIQTTVPGGTNIPFANNPSPQFMFLGEYEFTPFYGKISLTKQGVANLNIGGTAYAGMIFSSPTESSPAVGIGLNQRFFFTRNFGVKVDLAGLVYQKTDIFPVTPSKTLVFDILLNVGALWYFPQL